MVWVHLVPELKTLGSRPERPHVAVWQTDSTLQSAVTKSVGPPNTVAIEHLTVIQPVWLVKVFITEEEGPIQRST
jgi:hypothetical protein